MGQLLPDLRNTMQLLQNTLTDKNVLITLILILILGSLLRFYGLENQSLWNDELSSWKQSSYADLDTVIQKGVIPDVHPPRYQILLYFIEKYIGNSESILRLPSAISGVLSIFIIFLVGARLYSYKEGLIASTLMAVLWCPVYYSQEARSYAILLLFTLLATYFWISILEGLTGKARLSYYTIFGYVITAIMSCYLHYFGLYLIALQGLAAVLCSIRKRKAMTYALLIYCPIVLAYLPWLPSMFSQLNRGSIWIKPPRATFFIYYLGFLFNRSIIILLVVLVLYLFFILRSLCNILKTKEYNNIKVSLLSPGLLLILWLFVPFIGAYIKSILSAPILTYKNLIISLPAAYILLSRSITQLPLRVKNPSVLSFIISGLLLSHLVFIMNYYSKPHKTQFRQAVEFVLNRDHLYVNSLIIGYSWRPDYFNYYYERKRSPRRITLTAGQQEDIPKVSELLSQQRPKYIWYISAYRIPDTNFVSFLNGRLSLVEHKQFDTPFRGSTEVWLFENKQL